VVVVGPDAQAGEIGVVTVVNPSAYVLPITSRRHHGDIRCSLHRRVTLTGVSCVPRISFREYKFN